MPLERNLLEQGFWYFAWSRTREIRQKYFQIHFPWNQPLFLRICPWKSFEIWLFSHENPARSADFSANFDFFPVKIPRNQSIFPRICPWKSREILLFFPRNIRSPVRSLDVVSPQNLPVIHSSVITRCRSCRTYINPFVTFTDSRRWRCPMCFRVNEGMSLQDPSYPFYIMEQYTLQAPLFDLILLWYQTNDHSYGNS